MMRSRHSILKLFLMLSILIPLTAFSEEIGRITNVQGKVDILRAGRDSAEEVKVGDGVSIGDILRTKSDGKVEIRFMDSSIMKVGPKSRLGIDEYLYKPDEEKRAASLKLYRGSSGFNIQKTTFSGDGSKFEMKTRTAIAGVRGTEGILYSDTVERVYIKEGKVEFSNPLGTVMVTPGKVGEVMPGRAPVERPYRVDEYRKQEDKITSKTPEKGSDKGQKQTKEDVPAKEAEKDQKKGKDSSTDKGSEKKEQKQDKEGSTGKGSEKEQKQDKEASTGKEAEKEQKQGKEASAEKVPEEREKQGKETQKGETNAGKVDPAASSGKQAEATSKEEANTSKGESPSAVGKEVMITHGEEAGIAKNETATSQEKQVEATSKEETGVARSEPAGSSEKLELAPKEAPDITGGSQAASSAGKVEPQSQSNMVVQSTPVITVEPPAVSSTPSIGEGLGAASVTGVATLPVATESIAQPASQILPITDIAKRTTVNVTVTFPEK